MSKSSKKKRPKYNEEVISLLVERYGVTSQFVRASIRGDRVSQTSDGIKKDYAVMTAASKQAITQKFNDTNKVK